MIPVRACALFAVIAMLTACDPKPAEPVITAPATQIDTTALAPGWHEAAGPGETALFHRFPGSTRDFIMSCNGEAKSLLVESPAPTPDPVPDGAKANLQLSAVTLKGELSGFVRDDFAMWRLALSVTPDVIAALEGANSARLVQGALVAESGPDAAGHFKSFANSCAKITTQSPLQE